MKRHFGNLLSRVLWGGSSLTSAEHKILVALVAALPPALRTNVEAQFSAYNLVQRESDGRALNFYRKKNGIPNNMTGLPLLTHKSREAPLARLTASIGQGQEPLHAVLTAVDGRAFCVSFSRSLGRDVSAGAVQVESTVQAWRSNFEIADQDA